MTHIIIPVYTGEIFSPEVQAHISDLGRGDAIWAVGATFRLSRGSIKTDQYLLWPRTKEEYPKFQNTTQVDPHLAFRYSSSILLPIEELLQGEVLDDTIKQMRNHLAPKDVDPQIFTLIVLHGGVIILPYTPNTTLGRALAYLGCPKEAARMNTAAILDSRASAHQRLHFFHHAQSFLDAHQQPQAEAPAFTGRMLLSQMPQ